MLLPVVILAAATVVAVGFGLWRRRVDGRFSASRDARSATSSTTDGPLVEEVRQHRHEIHAAIAAAVPHAELGERATLVQFSSAFCAPCRTTRVVLADVAAREPGVAHVEIDAEQHLDLVRALDIRRTPTTLILDPAGAELTRAAGAPRREQVLAALPGNHQEA